MTCMGRPKMLAALTAKLAPELKAEMLEAADERGVSLSEYIRTLHLEARKVRRDYVPDEPQRPGFVVHHIDKIGPDPLWSGREALAR